MRAELGGAALAAALTLLLCPPLLALLRRLGVLDHPTARSSHQRPTLRGGGLAPALAALAAVALAVPAGAGRAGLLVAAAGFAAVGLLEDLRGVDPPARFALQLVAAALALPALLERLGGAPAWRLAFAAGVLAWLVSYANAFNFMDGINGIAGVQALIAGVCYAALAAAAGHHALAGAALVVAGVAAGFLPSNFPRARCFLGDVGSYFFGAALAALAVAGLRAHLAPEAVAAPLLCSLADTGTTLARRVRRGEPWHLPHREHAYQRLVALGWSHARTTLAVGAASAGCAGLGLLAAAAPLPLRAAADLGLAGVVGLYLASPALLAGQRAPLPAAPDLLGSVDA